MRIRMCSGRLIILLQLHGKKTEFVAQQDCLLLMWLVGSYVPVFNANIKSSNSWDSSSAISDPWPYPPEEGKVAPFCGLGFKSELACLACWKDALSQSGGTFLGWGGEKRKS